VVVGWSDLHAIHADEIEISQFLQQRQHLVRRHAAGFGCAGAWCERRVEAIDVEAEVERRVAVGGEPLPDRGGHGRQLRRALEASQLACIEDLPAPGSHVVARLANTGRADADLREALGNHETFLESLVDPGAVAAGFAEVVFPGVAVGIEMDHRQRSAEPGLVGSQQRQRDRVIAADPGHVVGADHRVHARRHGRAHGFEAGVGQRQVTQVGQVGRGVDVEVRMDAVAQHVACFADGARTEACARPVGDRAIPREAGDGIGPIGL